MKANNTLLRRLADHPRRRFIVITGTLLVAVVTILPAVDNYYHHRANLADNSAQLVEMELDLSRRADLLLLATKKKEELQQTESTLSTREDLFRLRSELIEMARQVGCSIRQEHLEDEQRRPWQHQIEADAKTTNDQKGKDQATPYDLVTHELLLDVVGPTANLQTFLEQIEGINKVKKTESLSLKVLPGADDQAELVLRIQWFDLPNATKKS